MRILSLLILSLFLFGCFRNPQREAAEAEGLAWAQSFVLEIIQDLSDNNPPPNFQKNFYVLQSFKHKQGFCVEIASQERKPPRQDDIAGVPTTVVLYVDDQGVHPEDASCYDKVYSNEISSMVQSMQQKSEQRERDKESGAKSGAENGKGEFTIAHFILTRESSNAFLKQRLKGMGYVPRY